MSRLRPLARRFVPLLSLAAVLTACSDPAAQPAGGAPKIPVSVITLKAEPVTLTSAQPGRVEAIRDAQIRARVNGIVTGIHFEQGSEVKEGQLLFTIDPAPYQAAYDQAAAQLQQAQADARAARTLSQRYTKLIEANAVSRQEYDNAVARTAQAEASIAAAQAALKAAKINLDYTKVTSPIAGRIGRALVTEGALVSAASATQLATVQQLDKVYIDSQRSTSELAQLRRALADGSLQVDGEGATQVRAILDDGSEYEHTGRLLFSGVLVDPSTGQVTVRSEFPNPDQVLLPGMYVRVSVPQGVDAQGLQVPQQALQRSGEGRASLFLVKEGRVSPVPVTTGADVGGNTLVTSGVQEGDVVIVEGFQKIRPGAEVAPMPWKLADASGSQAAPDPAQGDTSAAQPDAAQGDPTAAQPDAAQTPS